MPSEALLALHNLHTELETLHRFVKQQSEEGLLPVRFAELPIKLAYAKGQAETAKRHIERSEYGIGQQRARTPDKHRPAARGPPTRSMSTQTWGLAMVPKMAAAPSALSRPTSPRPWAQAPAASPRPMSPRAMSPRPGSPRVSAPAPAATPTATPIATPTGAPAATANSPVPAASPRSLSPRSLSFAPAPAPTPAAERATSPLGSPRSTAGSWVTTSSSAAEGRSRRPMLAVSRWPENEIEPREASTPREQAIKEDPSHALHMLYVKAPMHSDREPGPSEQTAMFAAQGAIAIKMMGGSARRAQWLRLVFLEWCAVTTGGEERRLRKIGKCDKRRQEFFMHDKKGCRLHIDRRPASPTSLAPSASAPMPHSARTPQSHSREAFGGGGDYGDVTPRGGYY